MYNLVIFIGDRYHFSHPMLDPNGGVFSFLIENELIIWPFFYLHFICVA